MIVYKDWEPEATVVSSLGNLNRARKLTYRGAAGLRRTREDRSEIEPTSIDELPE
jgi:hypothetical protein